MLIISVRLQYKARYNDRFIKGDFGLVRTYFILEVPVHGKEWWNKNLYSTLSRAFTHTHSIRSSKSHN